MLDFCSSDKFSLMKVLITVTQTDHPHRMKVFASLFSKSDCPSKGAQPLVASAEAKYSRRFFFAKLSSLRQRCQRRKRVKG